ncbi:hypothetical protein J416_06782 [Gracilibacillus halophilus YIM-C55.5]|uniref:DUF2524 family protein n=1 Tax=Gracilibacillus halophilus YIM-C55.5 TaxID=1308866 RepID=N4WD23_9BACI|nr:DUF2524 family protein [Gracilibacillus halophilus]ENH97134.1 hypothetical protein J416_06782 [Gracilibacillus halophilus YIM-C55.5]
MTTRESLEHLLAEGNQIIEQAEEQLQMSNRNHFHMNEDYTNAHLELEQLSEDIDRMMRSANHQQKEQLHRFQLVVREKLNDMILDEVDVTRFE